MSQPNLRTRCSGRLPPSTRWTFRLFRTRNFRAGLLVGAAVATLVLVPCFMARPTWHATSAEIDEAAQPFLNLLRDGDIKRAYRLTSSTFQAETPEAQFQHAFGRLSSLSGAIEVVQYRGPSAPQFPEVPAVYANYRVEGKRGDVELRLLLTRREGQWQVESCTFTPVPRHTTVPFGPPAS